MARDVGAAHGGHGGLELDLRRSPLDRLLRDAITVRTHIAVQDRLLEQSSALAVGEDPPVPFL